MSNHKFYVYIVRTRMEALYTGVAIDPKKRVEEHNSGTRGAKCLQGQRPVSLVWVTPGPMTRSDALKVEKKIKKLSREQKLELVNHKPKHAGANEVRTLEQEDRRRDLERSR